MAKNTLGSHVDDLIALIKEIYGEGFVSLHRPVFEGNEREYLTECIDSNFVSSVGTRVQEFENHCVTHLPYGSWLQICVKAKRRRDALKRQTGDEDGVAIVSMDCKSFGASEADGNGDQRSSSR